MSHQGRDPRAGGVTARRSAVVPAQRPALAQRPAPSRRQPSALPCRTGDPELWFAELPADVEAAKALCADCPLLAACLDGALERAEPWGVWGGQLVLDGVVVARKRPRGRPRKHPLPEPAGTVA